MSGGRWSRIVLAALVAAGALALLRKLRGPAAPQFSDHPSVSGGPTPEPEAREPAPAPARPSAPVPTDPPEADAPGAPAPESGTAWVPPLEGACPEGYPIKAKVSSGIFHRPGGLAYERTKPDRCYPDEAAAEADGFRAAKR
ncbi:MAG: hypothetical protein R2702_12755 [Acidimicrobiales bacterium]